MREELNKDVRDILRQCEIQYWKVSIHMGYSPAWLCETLGKKELSQSRKNKILRAIGEILKNEG